MTKNSSHSYVDVGDFYLDSPNLEDTLPIIKLAQDKNFFFDHFSYKGQLANLKIEYVATLALFGEYQDDLVKVVRLNTDNAFAGRIRFTNVKSGSATVSYFFDPTCNGATQEKAVLRAIDWFVRDRAFIALETSVAHDVKAEVRKLEVFTDIGFNPIKYIPRTRSTYVDRTGKARAELLICARREDILPALEIARNAGRYSQDIPVHG
jgi:hypothetical protein